MERSVLPPYPWLLVAAAIASSTDSESQSNPQRPAWPVGVCADSRRPRRQPESVGDRQDTAQADVPAKAERFGLDHWKQRHRRATGQPGQEQESGEHHDISCAEEEQEARSERKKICGQCASRAKSVRHRRNREFASSPEPIDEREDQRRVGWRGTDADQVGHQVNDEAPGDEVEREKPECYPPEDWA